MRAAGEDRINFSFNERLSARRSDPSSMNRLGSSMNPYGQARVPKADL